MYDDHHYTPEQLGELWNFSPNKIRALFQNEPDVIRDEKPEISETAARRVYARLAMRQPR
jgi:hypothetical protein